MVSTIFQPEINTLQSQIEQLQAQVVAAQSQIAALGECESMANDALAVLQGAVQKISGLAPNAIATLKSAVFSLFNSDGGSKPTNPALVPDLDGQSTQLCCLLEDAPSESLQSQSFELTCLIGHPDLCEGQLLDEPRGRQYVFGDDRGLPVATVKIEEEEPTEPAYIDLVQVSNFVAYMRRPCGEVIAVYAGGSNKTKLRNWGDWLTRTHSVTQGYELREAKRLDTKWELKLTSMTLAQIEKLAACDFSKDPRRCYPDAPQGKPETQIFQVGDSVEVKSDRHGAELVGLQGKVTVANSVGCVVAVADQTRWFCVDEIAPVVESAHLKRDPKDDLFPPSAPQPLTYNPYPIGRRGAVANWEAYQNRKRVEQEQKLVTASTSDDDIDF